MILASDVVMAARGDLGVEIGDPELVGIQKAADPSRASVEPRGDHRHPDDGIHDHQPMPTRAEVMDVASTPCWMVLTR